MRRQMLHKKTVEDIKKRDEVKWIVPIALGDSHQGYRLVQAVSILKDFVTVAIASSVC